MPRSLRCRTYRGAAFDFARRERDECGETTTWWWVITSNAEKAEDAVTFRPVERTGQYESLWQRIQRWLAS